MRENGTQMKEGHGLAATKSFPQGIFLARHRRPAAGPDAGRRGALTTTLGRWGIGGGAAELRLVDRAARPGDR
jgi:hypothetical protein